MTDEPVAVYVVDDDPGVLKAVSRLLRAEGLCVFAYNSANEFLAVCNGALRGCLVLDVAMPGLDGLELQRTLADNDCQLPIVFLTGHGDIPMTVRAMKFGAADFLSKPVDDTTLLAAIREAMARDAADEHSREEQADIRARLATLTPREREVLEHVVAGEMNKNIAAELGTVEKTIKVHRARVMAKMRVQSLAELVRLAERAGVRVR